MKMTKPGLIASVLVSILYSQESMSSPIDVQREDIIRYTRLGETQLQEGTKQLESLYQSTADKKVRDDLITLLVRQKRDKDALSLCANCNLSDLSVNELEYLAKAARNERQFQQSARYYEQLNKTSPKNPNGLLGLALVNTEMARFEAAKQYLTQYKRRLGEDKEYTQANNYLLDNSEPLTSRINRWQKELDKNPSNTEEARKLYRAAAQLNISPLQNRLIAMYPDLFTENDKLWLLHDEAIRLSKGSTTNAQLEQAYAMLTEASEKAPEGNPVKLQSLQDRVVVAAKLNNDTYLAESYTQLEQLNQPMPNYVRESYGDYLLASGSPFAALDTYRAIEDDYIEQKQAVPFTLKMKIVSAMSDAAKFSQAEDYMNQMGEPPLQVLDFTRTRRVVNPDYDEYFFAKVNLLAWRGNSAGAMEMTDERLAKTPGDGWWMLRKAELENANGRSDDALAWIDKAKAFLGEDSSWANVAHANVALSREDWKMTSSLINSFSSEEERATKYITNEYNRLTSARFVASGGISHRTWPAGQNESRQEYYLYSPKTADGHDVYVHYYASKSPDDGLDFEQRRIGAGLEANFYPLKVAIEAGKGIKLNEKGYLSTNIQYRLNQHWKFNLTGNLNGSNTPVKALYQDIYTKDIGFAANYIFSSRFDIGANVSVMKFDDDNLRKEIGVSSNINLFKHDRWNLDSNLSWFYQRNKNTPGAYYYNPLKSQSANGGLDLAYLQPFDHRIILTHHIKGDVGHYWQDRYAGSQTWSIGYGQEWRLDRKFSVSYDLGRKKTIYDGSPEFNNFINANLAVYF